MPFTIVNTKMYWAHVRPNLVTRPRLLEKLDRGLEQGHVLTLISAPAGYGKTTLLYEWLSAKDEGGRLKVAWLTVDQADNDPTHFWAYVILALQALHDELGEALLAQLRSPQPPPLQLILPALLNELDAFPGPGLLVLDDYHLVSSPAVHDSLTFLLDNLPPRLHLVLASRSDPPLPLAKLRSRGQLVELRADDLRFTPNEASAFLTQTMGLALSSQQVAALDERTEGWIAGLQMAALSLRGREAERVEEFLHAFAGTHRFIMDYLLEEVLAREPEEVQSFLLHTSLLTRLSGPLCDAVTGASGGQSMLERFEKRNLFVVPLDDERRWYRYHHLFADLLQAQLQKSLGGQEIAALHLRASGWFEHNGSPQEAIHHASLASDFERMERLIEQNYIEMMNRGEMALIRFWMGELKKELVYQRPWLSLYEAFSHCWFGQLEEANLLLNEAEKRIRSEGSTPDTRAMLGYHAYVKSRVTAMQGEARRAIELCLYARKNVPADNLGLQIEIGITLGYEYFLHGDFVNASKILHEVIAICQTVKAINNPVAAFALLARLHVIQGHLHDARDLVQKAAQLIHETEGQHRGVMGLVEAEQAALLHEWNEAETALVHAKQALDFLPLWGKADDVCLAYATLSRIHLARGNPTEAASAIEKADQVVQTSGVFSEARSVVETTQVKVWLAQRDWRAADRWENTLEERLNPRDLYQFEDELTRITQARVFIARTKPAKAIQLLSGLEESARSGGRQGRLIEILVLKALAMQAIGDTAQAESALAKSLALAEPEGYVRVFIDEGEAMRLLMADSRLAIEKSSPHLHAYLGKILAAFGSLAIENQQSKIVGPPPSAPLQAPTAAKPGVEPLLEPLSERESEVLRLMAEGLTNEQIAARLVIALGTVKAHLHNISGKLGAENRAHAVARAKELGLL